MATCPRFCPSTVCYLWLCKSIGFWGLPFNPKYSHALLLPKRTVCENLGNSPLVEPGLEGQDPIFTGLNWWTCLKIQVKTPTGWWQLNFFFMFIPDPWGNDPILTHIFQMGWFNHQLAKVSRPTGNHFQFGHVQKAPKGELSWTKDPEKWSCNGKCFLFSDLQDLHQITQHSV